MPATELLIPPAGNDSKPAGAPPSRQVEPPVVAASKAGGRLKWLLAAALAVVLAVGAVFYFQGTGQPGYLTSGVDRGTIEATVTATGNTNAVTTVQVGSQVSGNIIA